MPIPVNFAALKEMARTLLVGAVLAVLLAATIFMMVELLRLVT